MTLTVTKRDGRREAVDLTRVRAALAFATEGLAVDPVALEAQAVIGWQDGMPVSAIQRRHACPCRALTHMKKGRRHEEYDEGNPRPRSHSL